MKMKKKFASFFIQMNWIDFEFFFVSKVWFYFIDLLKCQVEIKWTYWELYIVQVHFGIFSCVAMSLTQYNWMICTKWNVIQLYCWWCSCIDRMLELSDCNAMKWNEIKWNEINWIRLYEWVNTSLNPKSNINSYCPFWTSTELLLKLLKLGLKRVKFKAPMMILRKS